MAPAKRKTQKPLSTESFDTNSAAGPFVVLKLRPELLQRFGETDIQTDEHLCKFRNRVLAKQLGIPAGPDSPEMQTRGAWSNNWANAKRVSPSPINPSLSPAPTNNHRRRNAGRVSKPKGGRKPKSSAVKRQPSSRIKRVSFSEYIDVLESTDSSRESSPESEPAHDTDKENDMASRPTLKLKLGSVSGAPSSDPFQTPQPQSAQRTPSIKLSFSRNSIDGAARPKVDSPAPFATPGGKKKKKGSVIIADKPITHTAPAPLRKLTLTNTKKPHKEETTPITPGALKLKTKGKIPKRPLGVGYDSELDEREVDPVILEGFILRMQPGPDCDYVRESIENGKIGISRVQGGANITMRALDTQGRRGLLNVEGRQYATSLVDLPCIIEGMKSWDKRGFIKSIDICQMLLVLGPCKTDDEAKTYPLPDDVNPHNYQYAHGITAPMKWVRRRRFARFKRARVDDVEAVDRKVNAMLEADALAVSSDWKITDHDPRLDEEEYSATDEEEDEEEEEEEDEDADGEPTDYFDRQNGTGGMVDTPGYVDTPQEEIDDDQVNEFERMFADNDDDIAMNGAPTHDPSLLAPEGAGDSSFAVTSTSASPSAAAADTPMSAVSANQTSDDDDDDADDDEEKDEDAADDDENVQQVKERIQEVEARILEQTQTLKKTQNVILRRKIASKIAELQGDVAVMRRSIGMGEPEGDDDEE